ncbi:MAG: ComEC/Rec2 family competence protein [Christensenellales bacterium]|jgi:competence protein ComEC
MKGLRPFLNPRPLCLSALLYATGILLSRALGDETTLLLLAGALLCLCAAAAVCRYFAVLPYILLLLLAFCVGYTALAPRYVRMPVTPVRLTGRVCSEVQAHPRGVAAVLDDAYIADAQDQRIALGRVALTLYGESTLRYGDVIDVPAARVALPQSAQTGSTYDERLHLLIDGIRYKAAANACEITGQRRDFYGALLDAKAHIVRVIDTSFEYPNIIRGILLGGSLDMEAEQIGAFKDTGLYHLFSVSGLHVAIITGLLAFVFKKVKKERAALFFIAPFLLLYCALADFSPPIIRASLMSLYYLIAKRSGQAYDLLNAVAFSVMVMLLVNPLYVFDVGFQLSYASVLGIALLMQVFLKPFKKKDLFLDSAAVSLSAQAGNLMVSAYYFNRIPIAGILVNVLLVPLFSVVLIAAFCAVILGLVIAPLGHMAALLPDAMLLGILWLIEAVASVSWLNITTTPPPVLSIVLWFCAMVAASKYFMARAALKTALTAALALAALALWML